MIEINLIPDVKYELLRARRMRASVISLSILAAIISGGVVTLLTIYVFGVQAVAGGLTDNAIKDEYKKLSQVEDLSKTLTIQNQLSQLSALQADKMKTSRLLDLVATIVPSGENRVSISTLDLDTDEGTITMEAEARNGYEALEVFKKTIAETRFEYKENGEQQQAVEIALSLSDGDRSYGENSDGERVLRFTLTFEYPEELFSNTAEQGRIVAPSRQNATDSAAGVPKSLFTDGVREETE